MNIFRLTGDFLHLLAIFILLFKIWKTRSCAGISGKSQILFVIVYITRYLDLFTTSISLYNSVMKVIFIGASVATVFCVFATFRTTYDRNHDSFCIEFLLISTINLALLMNHDFTVMEILWTFSIYLESVAILPQLLLIIKTGKAESIISYYLILFGSYRAFYILNWIDRYITEHYLDLICIFAGVIQTILICIFFCSYPLFTDKRKEKDCPTSEEKCPLDRLRNEIYKEFQLGAEQPAKHEYKQWVKPEMSMSQISEMENTARKLEAGLAFPTGYSLNDCGSTLTFEAKDRLNEAVHDATNIGICDIGAATQNVMKSNDAEIDGKTYQKEVYDKGTEEPHPSLCDIKGSNIA